MDINICEKILEPFIKENDLIFYSVELTKEASELVLRVTLDKEDGIDLEMDKDGYHYVVSVKSGPKWSNSTSLAKQMEHFRKAIRIYNTSGNKIPCLAIEGCCYGKEHIENDTRTKLCGQAFWQFISGSDTLYKDIIEPLGTDAKTRNDAFQKEYDAMINKFTSQFISKYCNEDGYIKWKEILEFNSGFQYPKNKK